jgi:hypothetical protein
LLSNLLVPNKAQLAILKFANSIQQNFFVSEIESSNESPKKKRVRYEDEILMEDLIIEQEATKKSVLEDFKTKDEKSHLRRSKSELYQGEKCVFDLFREAQSYQYYQEILSDYNKVSIGVSNLFSSHEQTDSKSSFIDLQTSQIAKRNTAKVSILGSVGSETYKKRLEDDESRSILERQYKK